MECNKGTRECCMEQSGRIPLKVGRNESKSRSEPIWIFGYGSLCWNPGFEYQESVTGYVKGFSRRFWQGNTEHRGTELKPGRVATLIEDEEGIAWGRAYLVPADNSAALPYLANRECELGGYGTYNLNFYPIEVDQEVSNKRIQAYTYIATPGNRHWLGTAPLAEIAKQILESNGPSGSNVEYLLRLADFMRDEIPEAFDEHLFNLERLVKIFAADMKVCLKSLMGEVPKDHEESKSETKATPSYQFASRVPEKKLRCLNM